MWEGARTVSVMTYIISLFVRGAAKPLLRVGLVGSAIKGVRVLGALTMTVCGCVYAVDV